MSLCVQNIPILPKIGFDYTINDLEHFKQMKTKVCSIKNIKQPNIYGWGLEEEHIKHYIENKIMKVFKDSFPLDWCNHFGLRQISISTTPYNISWYGKIRRIQTTWKDKTISLVYIGDLIENQEHHGIIEDYPIGEFYVKAFYRYEEDQSNKVSFGTFLTAKGIMAIAKHYAHNEKAFHKILSFAHLATIRCFISFQ